MILSAEQIRQVRDSIRPQLKDLLLTLDHGWETRRDELLKEAINFEIPHRFQNLKYVFKESQELDINGAKLVVDLSIAVGMAFAGVALATVVGASVASFGIVPIAGLIVGAGVTTLFNEWEHQRASKKLHKSLAVLDSLNHEEKIKTILTVLKTCGGKINRKFDRLKNSRSGSGPHLHYYSPHEKEAKPSDFALGLGLLDDHYDRKSAESSHLALAALDLHFHAQKTFNASNFFLKEVTGKKIAFLDFMWKVRHAIGLQVRLSGKHSNCQACKAEMNLDKWDTFSRDSKSLLLNQLRNLGIPPLALSESEQDQEMKDLILEILTSYEPEVRNNDYKVKIQDIDKTEVDFKSAEALASAAALSASPAVDAAVTQAFSPEELSNLATNAATGSLDAASVSTGVFLGVAVSNVIEYSKAMYKNRTTNIKISELSNPIAIELLNSAEIESHEEISGVDFSRAHLTLLGGRIAHLWHKIHELEKTQSGLLLAMKSENYLIFSTCDEAHKAWYQLSYIFKQWCKLEITVISLMAVLLNLDHKMAVKYNITKSGAIVTHNGIGDGEVHEPSYSIKENAQLFAPNISI